MVENQYDIEPHLLGMTGLVNHFRDRLRARADSNQAAPVAHS